ncbi:2-C-methyl-D-erythritol 2,4-cyclodiphosphate synthase [candidate division KSB1 bacterium]
MRVGIGYDAHRLVKERKLVLGGVEIPHEKGLLGHSDADVLAHAVSDALLGAAALGDIGKHFPDTDPQYKGVSSLLLLEKIARMLNEKGWTITNVDTVLVMQEPRIGPYADQMRRNIAKALTIEADRVSIKATTTETMGFEGKKEGISAHAVCLLIGKK